MDLMVLKAQKWVNSEYKGKHGYVEVEATGKTGWATMRSLIRALQIEEGISSPNGSFGPATTRNCPTVSEGDKNKNLVKIIQSALYCKGYNPTGITGTFGPSTKAAVARLQSDAGLPMTDGVVTPMIFKALLCMDAYVLLRRGDSRIRTIQRGLNNKYYKTIGVMPCDGIYSRGTNKSLIYALQIEEGISGANGHFGPGTSRNCPKLKIGDKSRFVSILKYVLYCNGFDANNFNTEFDNDTENAVIEFQSFSALDATGVVDLRTWKSLLISTGDNSRKGAACDCVTRITPERAKSLKSAGYKVVGRYLAKVPGGLDKNLTESELKNIFDAGLRVFPIFQLSGNHKSYFSKEQGSKDARQAIKAALDFGFPENTIIYFSVDFDAMDYDIDNGILPYFKAIKSEFVLNTSRRYKIGVYAPRNICTRVSNVGFACSSFVCDMSTGFSGNLGFALPKNWAFDQISTISVGSGSGFIEIDNNICSGKDLGVSYVKTYNRSEFISKIFALFGLEESNEDLTFKKEKRTSEGVFVFESKPKIASGGEILKYECDVTNKKIQLSNVLDGVLSKITKQESKIKEINALKNEIGTIIGEGKVSVAITHDKKHGFGYKFEAEQEFAKIENVVTQSYCASIAFFPQKKEHKITEEVISTVKSLSPYVAIIAIIALVAGIFLAPEVGIVALVTEIVTAITALVPAI